MLNNISSCYIIICTFLPVISMAQNKAGVATYLLKTETGLINSELDFSDSASLFISHKIGMDTGINTSSTLSFNEDSENKGLSVFISGYDSIGNLIYRNFKTQDITLRGNAMPPFKATIIQDNWLPMNWKIDSVFNTVCGLKCQKATGYFRGRYYTAWFAPGIPVPYGPWKLFGLPGLIVMAYDRDNVFYAALTSLCYPCNQLKTAIKKPYELKNITIKEDVYFHNHLAEELVKETNKGLPDGVRATSPKSLRTIKEQRNHAFEKTYEWEEKKPKFSIKIPKQ